MSRRLHIGNHCEDLFPPAVKMQLFLKIIFLKLPVTDNQEDDADPG